MLIEDWLTFKEQITIDERVTEIVGWVVSGTIGGAVSGILTGLWLVWLLRSRWPNTTDTSVS
jgi:hypothetical protein